MKKIRFTEEQIIGFLKQAEVGMAIKELCCNGGFSDATFYKWRVKFGGMQVSEAQRLLAGAHLDVRALKSVLGAKCWPLRLCARPRPGCHNQASSSDAKRVAL